VLAARLPRARGRRRARGGRGAHRRCAHSSGGGGRVPLLRAHLHDGLVPAPDRPAAHRRARLPAAGARRAPGGRSRAPGRRPRPARLLRHVLRHEDPMLSAVLAAAALAAGITGAWSPCGFSMVETLSPQGYAVRLRTTLAACVTFTLGALAGGAATFGGLAAA